MKQGIYNKPVQRNKHTSMMPPMARRSQQGLFHRVRSFFVKFHKSGSHMFKRQHLKLDTTNEFAYVDEEQAELQRFCGLAIGPVSGDGPRQ